MSNFCNIFDYTNVLNIEPSVLMYYDKEERDFIPLEYGDPIPQSYVEVPYALEIETAAMQRFWAELGHRKSDCPSPRRFRGYLLNHGLVEDFKAYEASLVVPYMKAWAAANDIQLCWEHYCVI